MFSIGTLTHDDEKRDEYLEKTVCTFLESTDLPKKTNWFIFHNGSYDSPVIKKIRQLTEEWGSVVNFIVFCDNKNYGVGKGINELNKWLRHSEYSLFLEGDWITAPAEITNRNRNWLIESLNFMKEKNIDQLQLRRYLNDVDDRQFGLGYWTKSQNIEIVEDGYVLLKEREYTNNPHIRRNKAYFDAGIFPLTEFYDEEGNPTELKTGTHWGQAELVAEPLGRQLKSAWIKGGIMMHCDHFQYSNWEQVKSLITGCDYSDGSLTRCKYGFLFPREEFCKHCRKEKDFTDLEEHNWLFERSLQ